MGTWTPSGIITLTTDFGTSGSYVGALRGAALSRSPRSQVVDVTHEIEAQDVREAARVLTAACPQFPMGTVHCVVVDPGVGTSRAAIVVEAGGHAFVGPDNGVLAPVVEALGPAAAYRIDDPSLKAPSVSNTFHGRDIFAPVAGRLAAGLEPSAVGERLDEMVLLATPHARVGSKNIRGEVLAVDHFGNVLTNIAFDLLPAVARVSINGATIENRVVSYGHASPGDLVYLCSSENVLEVAVSNGSAAERLAAVRGDRVEVTWA